MLPEYYQQLTSKRQRFTGFTVLEFHESYKPPRVILKFKDRGWRCILLDDYLSVLGDLDDPTLWEVE